MTKKEQRFIDTVWAHYHTHGRHTLPWRETSDPYHILVSEVMLQQTQVDRVLTQYTSFLKQFPTVESLARAPLRAVLLAWQGLGYNRRAKMLHEAAKAVCAEHEGEVPSTYEDLVSLPGIGPYTAGAIMAFAHKQAHPLIETNVRSVYLFHFFRHKEGVPEKDIVRIVERTCDQHDPRQWYWALMDYGAYIKRTHGNQNKRSRAYVRQSAFAGSARQVRGALVRTLLQERLTYRQLVKKLSSLDPSMLQQQLDALCEEGFIQKSGRYYSTSS